MPGLDDFRPWDSSDILVGVDTDAVVIGGGAAGLAAARSLACRSLRVVLLEARDRVGGRAWTRPVPRSVTPAELGAEFIHGRADLTMQILRKAGLAAVDTDGEAWACSKDGELHPDDRLSGAAGLFEAARALTADESVDQFLRRYERDEASREIARAARAFVEGFDAADPAVASVRSIAEEWGSGVDFAIARPLGGYRPMFEYLREACTAAGVQVHLSTVVRRVSWRRGAVAVEAASSGELRTIHARTAIVTLPAGVLRHRGDDTAVVFHPELPPAKREALRWIEMGHVIKVVLWFRTPFWERLHHRQYHDVSFFVCEGQPFPTYWTQLPVRSRLVVAWVGGPRAAALSGAAHDDLIARALTGFGALFQEPGLARTEFEGGVTHDWTQDPFSRGAYSYITVGNVRARDALAAPVDETVFFAGEATSTDGQGGTVNGALETGERAAREAAAALDAKARRPHNA